MVSHPSPIGELAHAIHVGLDAQEMRIRDWRCINCGAPITPMRSPFGITGYTHADPTWQGVRCRSSLTGADRVHFPKQALAEIELKRVMVRELMAEEHQDDCYTELLKPRGVCDCGLDKRVARYLDLLLRMLPEKP